MKNRYLILLVVPVLALSLAMMLVVGLQRPALAKVEAAHEARLQVTHLAPFSAGSGTAVTVTLNSSAVLTDFVFGESTGYIEVEPGTYLVEIFPGGSSTPAITGSVDLMTDTDYTAIAVGGPNSQPLALKVLDDDNTAPTAGTFKLRLGHLAPFAAGAATADVRLQDGTPVITDVVYGAVAPYIELPAGTYDLKITTPGGGTTLIDPLPATFNDGDIVSAFAVGDGTNQDLGVFALPSGVEGSLLALTRLAVAHLAPFAMDPGTAVTVTLNGAAVLTDFEYGDSTAYLDVAPGTYLVEIFPGGSSTPAITGSVDLMQGMEYSAIAIGGPNSQPLELVALVDDNSAPTTGNFKLRLGHLAPFASGTATADVRLQDGTAVLTDVDYTDVMTTYLELPAGTYDLKITTPGGVTTLIDPLPATFNDGDIVSAFAVGDGTNQGLGVFAWPSNAEGFLLPMTRLRVAHLAPFAMDPGTAVTVTLDGAAVLTDFEFGDSTAYIDMAPGTYLVEIFPGGSSTPAITGSVDLMQGMEYSAIATGDGSNQSLGLLALVDDNTAPTAGNFKLRLGHLAPFTSTAATADVRLQDGTAVLTDVDYGVVMTGYLELTAGTYDLKITTPGGGTTLIDPPPARFHDGQIVSAFAVGDGTNQDLAVFAWPSNAEGFFIRYMLFLPSVFTDQP